MLARPHHGEDFQAALEDYLTGTLHQKVRLGAWSEARRLPSFLATNYAYYKTTIADRACLFMASLDGQDGTPAEISKHIGRIQRVFAGIVAYAAPRMSSHQRARLITHGVAFAVPGRQLYIPQLAVDLREQFGARHLSQDGHMAPVSQAVLFHYILRRNPDLITPSTLADALHYSPMSIGRAFDELASLGLARITRAGREKQLSIDRTSQELIEAVRPHLRSPVHKKYYLREMPTTSDLKLAGETALAELSTLAPPAIKVFATGNDDYRTALKGRRAEQVAHEDEADAVIEIWRYDPATLSDSSVVDVLSLYAQFWNHSHERVASAAADLLERLNW